MGIPMEYGCNGVWIEGAHDCNGAFHSSQTVQVFKAKDLSPSGGMIQTRQPLEVLTPRSCQEAPDGGPDHCAACGPS